jgi:hypothetical protein
MIDGSSHSYVWEIKVDWHLPRATWLDNGKAEIEGLASLRCLYLSTWVLAVPPEQCEGHEWLSGAKTQCHSPAQPQQLHGASPCAL